MLLRLSLLTVLLFSSSLSAQEWTRFRGPNGTGVSATSFPAKWSAEDIAWQTDLPGIGHSSPCVWGEKVFLLSADPETAQRFVICADASTGKILWQRDFATQPHHLHARSSYASCSPAVDSEHVYVAWSDPKHTVLMALDHAGETAWSRDLGPWVSQHGFGMSPMVYGDIVILANHQQGREKLPPGQQPGVSSMEAFDRATGESRWKTPRESTVAAYSVPCILNRDGRDELVCCSNAHGVFSLEPATGKPLWAVKDAFSMRTVSSPVIAGGLVIGTTGSGGGGNYLVAVRPGEKAEIAYKIDRQAPYVPTPVAQGELLYLWSDQGVVTCVEGASGKQVWQKRVGGNFSGSPILAGDKLYCLDEEGVVVVLAAGREFKELGRNPLGEAGRSTPAVSGGKMYFRTDSKLFCLEAEKS